MSNKTTLSFEQLSEEAKEKAREWYREHLINNFDFEVQTLTNMFYDQLRDLGFEVVQDNISWELTNSQNDHVSFYGKMKEEKFIEFFRSFLQSDEDKEWFEHFINGEHIKLVHEVGHDNDSEVWIDFMYSNNLLKDYPLETFKYKYEGMIEQGLNDYVARVCRDLKSFGYQFIEDCLSDERVDENIVANEYRFDEDGNIQ